MNRIESVDSVRLLAIISVIAIHTEPFFYQTLGSKVYFHLEVVINQFARFAVPFFFVISGYFWGLKIRSGKHLLVATNKMGFRIICIFLVWSLIYLLPYNLSIIYEIGILSAMEVACSNLLVLLREPGVMLLEGTKGHLWFLVGLLFALYISFLFVNRNAEKLLLVFSVFLYIAGVLLKSYSDSPVGYSVDFNTRNGPFFSTLLFSSGYFISRYRPNLSWFNYGLITFVFGVLLHFTEIYMLNKFYGTSTVQDYVFGTYLMGFGAAVLSLSNHSLLRVKALSRFGQMVLGVYAVHIIFVDIARPIDMIIDSIWWELGYVLLVLILSIVSVVWMSKVPILKRVVS
jgi:surface polysaccharide O-acyltransferase-like enzyme